MDKHMTYPLENNTQNNIEIYYKININKKSIYYCLKNK